MATGNSTRRAHNFIDLTGQTFGKWTVVCFSCAKHGKALWLCRCKCGYEGVVYGNNLTKGTSTRCKSCQITTHGYTGSVEYRTWIGMRQRCRNKNRSAYKDYGGRSISVCEGWSSFEAFLADIGPRPAGSYSVDRKDNDGNYSCGHCRECLGNGWFANCRWATPREQSRNTRRTRLLTYCDKSMCVVDWAAEIGINVRTLQARLRLGWSVERALTSQVRPHKRRSSHNSCLHRV